ncbi:MAG TPA: T9SS type A sorting domain-containing protein [Candidatus Kapabacteria bacterium]
MTFALADSSRQTTIAPGTDVSINVPVEINTSLGSDSLHLVLRYDSALELKTILATGGLSLLDSSVNGDTLNLWVALDSNTVTSPPNIAITFKTFLTTNLTTNLTAKIHLDSIQFYGGCQTCNCALAVSHPDSVEVDFTGCGDSILLETLRGEPFTFSIVPNPAQTEFQISGTGFGSEMSVELYDVLGNPIAPHILSRTTASLAVDASALPAGIYYVRLSSRGYVQTRALRITR